MASARVTPFEGCLKATDRRSLRLRRPSGLEVFAASLVALSLVAVMILGLRDPVPPASLWAVVLLGLVAAASERASVAIGPHARGSASSLPILFAALVLGPFPAMLVAAVAMLPDLRRPLLRWVIWTSSSMLMAAAAGLVAEAVLVDWDFVRVLLAACLACVTAAVANLLLTSATISLRRSGAFTETIASLSKLAFSPIPLYASILAILGFLYVEFTPWVLVVFIGPALAAHRSFVLYNEQRALAARLKEANNRLEEASLSFASGLISALDARDEYTAGHSAAVAIYARDIAEELGLSREQQEEVHLCGLLHDIGKVGLPAGLLEKPGPLSPSERKAMEQHVTIGERILSRVHGYRDMALVVRYHHERLDGTGYPEGLLGSEIPLYSRIIAVADAYSAMTSGRPYRPALASSIALERLRRGVGSQFDPALVAAFERVIHCQEREYATGCGSSFSLTALTNAPLAAAAPVPSAAA
jgi:putative nucleotidyltransferase with HDIG domain